MVASGRGHSATPRRRQYTEVDIQRVRWEKGPYDLRGGEWRRVLVYGLEDNSKGIEGALLRTECNQSLRGRISRVNSRPRVSFVLRVFTFPSYSGGFWVPRGRPYSALI